MRVILDGMGGDNAPSAIVEGAVLASEKCDKEIVIVGDEAEISANLKKYGYKGDKISIINAGEVIDNDESPVQAVRKKKDSSLVKGISELLENPEDIFISAGSTLKSLYRACLFNINGYSGLFSSAIQVADRKSVV